MKWTSLRLDRGAADRLKGHLAQIQAAVRRYPRRYPAWMRDKQLSLADAIVWLMDLRETQQLRAKRHRKGRTLHAPDGIATLIQFPA